MFYEFALHADLASVHPVFHVSMLKNCLGDPSSILPIEGLGVGEDLYYEEVHVEILDRHVKRLRNKEITTVKVLWRNHLSKGVTLEVEADKIPLPSSFQLLRLDFLLLSLCFLISPYFVAIG